MFPLLLHCDSQVHAGMDTTIVVKCPGGIERTNWMAIVAIKLQVTDDRRTTFCCGFWRSVVPGTVGDNVNHRGIINQSDATAFANRYCCLHEIVGVHMDITTPTARIAPTAASTGSYENGEYA